jgi:glycosyltransferase involved in cell wall biosynthesis
MNIYFMCPDTNEPFGGVKGLYKYVDALNRNGIDASIVHSRKGFRCTWFENDSAVRYADEIVHDPSDYWVVPEVSSPETWPAPGSRKVILNQNCYYTFNDCYRDPEGDVPSVLHEDVVAVQTVSDDNMRYFQYALPGLKVARFHFPLDSRLFAFSEDKKPRIAYMPRKNWEDAAQVLSILRLRGALEGLELVPVENRSEAEVASLLKDAFLFLSFGYPEGLGLPPAEAMLSGCVVVGFHGMGGVEFFKPEFSYPIAAGDILSFARTAEEVIDTFRRSPEKLTEKARLAAAFIGENYNMERFSSDVAGFWKDLLESDAAVDARKAKEQLLERWNRFPGFPVQDDTYACYRKDELKAEVEHLVDLHEKDSEYIDGLKRYIKSLEEEEQKKGVELEKAGEYARGLEQVIADQAASLAAAEQAGVSRIPEARGKTGKFGLFMTYIKTDGFFATLKRSLVYVTKKFTAR